LVNPVEGDIAMIQILAWLMGVPLIVIIIMTVLL